jgi:hypothetical protein
MTQPAPSRAWRRAGSASLAVLLLAALAPLSAAAAGPPPFIGRIGDCQVNGNGPLSQSVAFTWRAANGRLKSRQTVMTDPGGEWQSRCEPEERVESGDRLSRTISGVTKKLTVPTLTVKVDRITDVVSGRAPAGSALHIEIFGRLGNAFHDLTVGGSGTYSQDFTVDQPIFGSDDITVEWQNAAGSRIDVETQAPHVVVYRGESQFQVVTSAGKAVTVQLLDGATVVGTGTATGPTFSGDFLDAHREPVVVKAGDTVKAPLVASDADFVVPAVTLAVNTATDVLSGTCLPDGQYLMHVNRRNNDVSDEFGGIADGAGHVSVGFTGFIDIKSGDKARLECHTPAGDIVVRRLTVP